LERERNQVARVLVFDFLRHRQHPLHLLTLSSNSRTSVMLECRRVSMDFTLE
jgi:hypothetical protein